MPGRRTVLNLLRTAMQPIGTTLYIYGGGWNEQDTGADVAARAPLPSPAWRAFFLSQNVAYDYRRFLDPRFRRCGLDCSGYLGWTLCATLHSEPQNEGYVCPSTEMAGRLAARGLGTLLRFPTDFLPGDVFSMSGHVWLCVGACRDGSLVIAHSSPTPDRIGTGRGGGAQLSALPPDDSNLSCEALTLARHYMRRFPTWSARYAAQAKPRAQYTVLPDNPNSGLFRFTALSDPENIKNQDAPTILSALFL
ncbi:hypothetical protein [Agathobaculum sp.]|uniref:hypothetical protein n=1 Tax=Agathobaculum sp. TaxID=2048138 RepID=UPI003AF0849F